MSIARAVLDEEESRGVVQEWIQQTCIYKHVYTAATIFAQYTVPETMRQHIKSNAKRGRPAKRKRALEYQPGEMPSPEKMSKEARVEENDDEDIFNDAFEDCL